MKEKASDIRGIQHKWIELCLNDVPSLKMLKWDSLRLPIPRTHGKEKVVT